MGIVPASNDPIVAGCNAKTTSTVRRPSRGRPEQTLRRRKTRGQNRSANTALKSSAP